MIRITENENEIIITISRHLVTQKWPVLKRCLFMFHASVVSVFNPYGDQLLSVTQTAGAASFKLDP